MVGCSHLTAQRVSSSRQLYWSERALRTAADTEADADVGADVAAVAETAAVELTKQKATETVKRLDRRAGAQGERVENVTADQ